MEEPEETATADEVGGSEGEDDEKREEQSRRTANINL